jgi:hypothetical protein
MLRDSKAFQTFSLARSDVSTPSQLRPTRSQSSQLPLRVIRRGQVESCITNRFWLSSPVSHHRDPESFDLYYFMAPVNEETISRARAGVYNTLGYITIATDPHALG